MKKIHSLLCMLLLVVSFSSCESNDDNNNSGPNDAAFAENFGNTASKDFIGQIVDIYNNPIQGVTIKIGSLSTQTDVNGVFILNGAEVYERYAHITATKSGYIDGSRSMVPTSGKNNVKIMLLPNDPLETIQSGVTSEVSIYSGTKIVFDGAFVDANGNDYSGSVQVAMFHLTPTDENISKLMPGMLYAQTETNEQAVLETFGMINVELRGSAGQKLNIKEGHTAEITMRIDDSQLATAPSSIPLWHFDEERGYWKEDGVATKVGNKYVGEVSHFSWWNCDAPFPLVTLTVTIVDANGNGISNVGVGLIANGNTWPVMGYTNNQGQISGLVPSNQTIVLNVYPDYYGCNSSNIIYTTSIGPFSANTTLPNIVINNSSTTMSSTVVGNLVKCNNTNVTNGYVILNRAGGYSVSPVTNGAFSFNEIYCPSNTQFTLKGYDMENLQTTDSIAYNFTSPITTIGNLQACTAVDEFISYQVDNNPTVFLIQSVNGGASGQGTPNTNGFYLSGFNNNDQSSIYIWGSTNVPGVYTTDEFSIEGGIGYIYSGTTNTLQFNLNQVGAVGQYIDMTFSGTYTDSNGVHTLTGVAHVIRDN
ncbi:Ig-like domain-containing protein [Flavobacterium buctense]|uniref:Ig-like domain-containing protein n=1 Tax=Flavobacterium buctense TaxID=1648146 RepID=UPI00165731AF|nr:Ig-like domain-containing protein [Flavobacterium buctense]